MRRWRRWGFDFFTSTDEGDWEGDGERVIRVYIKVGMCGGRKGREARAQGRDGASLALVFVGRVLV